MSNMDHITLLNKQYPVVFDKDLGHYFYWEPSIKGVFDNYRDDNYMRRCDILYVLFNQFGKGFDPSTIDTKIKEFSDEVCGEVAYYRKAIEWFYSDEAGNILGFYNFRDMDNYMSYLELAYILYVVINFNKSTDWNEVSNQIPQHLGISVITINQHTNPVLDLRLTPYKGSYSEVVHWLEDLRTNRRYIPLVGYASVNELLVSHLHSLFGDSNISPEDVMFCPVLSRDFQVLIEGLSNVQ